MAAGRIFSFYSEKSKDSILQNLCLGAIELRLKGKGRSVSAGGMGERP
jgi:hypothetical protein